MENFVTYDPLADKSPIGVISKHNKVRYFINSTCDDIEFAYFVIKKDENDNFEYFEMTKCEKGYFIEYTFDVAGHYWYSFQVKKGNDYFYINKTFDNYSYLSHYAFDL